MHTQSAYPEVVDILEETVDILSDDASLTGVLSYPFVGIPARSALIVGPHPLMGGRLENNVVRSVGRGLAEHGMLTLRFQFRNWGASAEVMDQFWKTGHAPDDPQRAGDAAAAAAWLRTIHSGATLLVGYSFGGSLLADLVTDHTLGVVLIGATLAQHDYARLQARPVPKLLITADNDFATPLTTTQRWFEAAAEPKRMAIVPAAEHFYRDQEDRLVQEIMRWLPT